MNLLVKGSTDIKIELIPDHCGIRHEYISYRDILLSLSENGNDLMFQYTEIINSENIKEAEKIFNIKARESQMYCARIENGKLYKYRAGVNLGGYTGDWFNEGEITSYKKIDIIPIDDWLDSHDHWDGQQSSPSSHYTANYIVGLLKKLKK